MEGQVGTVARSSLDPSTQPLTEFSSDTGPTGSSRRPRSWSSYGMMQLATTPRTRCELTASMFREAVTDSESKVRTRVHEIRSSEESSEST